MPNIHILAVGRLREPYWKEAAEAYLKRLRHGYAVTETIVRDGDSALTPAERATIEGERILQTLKSTQTIICLDERGESMASTHFAHLLQQSFDTARTPCFVIGGAYGLSDTVKSRASRLLSFGPMTLPHELARVLLLEQLYRADSILRGRPYHHG